MMLMPTTKASPSAALYTRIGTVFYYPKVFVLPDNSEVEVIQCMESKGIMVDRYA